MRGWRDDFAGCRECVQIGQPGGERVVHAAVVDLVVDVDQAVAEPSKTSPGWSAEASTRRGHHPVGTYPARGDVVADVWFESGHRSGTGGRRNTRCASAQP